MREKIAEDEDDRDCNHKRPYLRDGAGTDSQLAQLFRYEPRLTNYKPCASGFRPSHLQPSTP
jgi:hypothetical protein